MWVALGGRRGRACTATPSSHGRANGGSLGGDGLDGCCAPLRAAARRTRSPTRVKSGPVGGLVAAATVLPAVCHTQIHPLCGAGHARAGAQLLRGRQRDPAFAASDPLAGFRAAPIKKKEKKGSYRLPASRCLSPQSRRRSIPRGTGVSLLANPFPPLRPCRPEPFPPHPTPPIPHHTTLEVLNWLHPRRHHRPVGEPGLPPSHGGQGRGSQICAGQQLAGSSNLPCS